MPLIAAAAAASMHHEHTGAIVGVILAFMGIGTIALLVSNRAQTAGVTTATGGAIGKVICIALSPVTGASCGSVASTTATNVTSTLCFPGIDPGC